MELFKYQLDIIKWAYNRKKAALFLDMGLGKTVIGCELLKTISNNKPKIVICPKNALTSWKKHFKQLLLNEKTLVLDKGLKKNTQLLSESGKVYDVILTTHSQLLSIFHLVKLIDFGTVLLDESHLLRNWNKRTQQALILSKDVEYIFILTGTPTGNKDYLDYYFQLKILGEWPGTKKEFENKFCIMEERHNFSTHTRWLELVGFKNTDELDRIVGRCSVRLKRETKATTHKVQFNNNKLFFQYSKDKILKFDSHTLVCDTATKLYYHLRLFSSGVCVDEEEKIVILSYHKLNWLVEFINKNKNNRILIWYTYQVERKVLMFLLKELKRPISRIDGDGVSGKDLNHWDKENTICLCQYQSASTGTNELVTSHIAVYFSPSTSVIDWRQSHKRIDRLGQTHDPHHYHLITENSLDSKVLKNIESGVSFGIKDFEDLKDWD